MVAWLSKQGGARSAGKGWRAADVRHPVLPAVRRPVLPAVRRPVPPAVRLLVCAALLASLGLGCSGYVKRGSALYADGRYIEAAEVFERTETRLAESNPRQQAEYGLYRGLTLLVLGDTYGAKRWLAYAYQLEQRHPGVLRGNRRAMLDRGWQELGNSGDLPPGPAGPAMALHPTVAAPPPAAAPPTPGPSPAVPGRRSLMPQ